MEPQLFRWIQSQQDTLDRLILDAAREFRSAEDHADFIFDCRIIAAEMWNLSKGKDLCYDRPAIGFIYSLWYHGKRVNTFLRYYLNLILESLNEPAIEIFDLGAGTGAVQWAAGIVYAALKRLNIKPPALTVVNIDSSPFMLHYNENYLWKQFVREYPECGEIITIYRVNSWVNEAKLPGANVWLSASYLFDHSENAKEVADEFQNLVTEFEPGKVLLLSATGKAAFVNEVANTLAGTGFEIRSGNGNLTDPVFHGQLRRVNTYRNTLQQQADYCFSGSAGWEREGLYGVVLVKKQGVFFPKDREKINLYVSPEKNRRNIVLTKEQRRAAEIRDNHSIIVGPAGCGKSVVLTQKVRNIVENPADPYNPDKKILVTTFNKDLVHLLGDWIGQLLDCPARCARQQWVKNGKNEPYSWFTFKGSKEANIIVYHFDILPTRIGGIPSCNVTKNGQDIGSFHLTVMQQVAQEYAMAHKLDEKTMFKILDPVFLLEEYHRIIYGWQCTTEAVYQVKERIGRGNNPTLQYKKLRRRVVWDIITGYLRKLNAEGLGNFTMQRHRLLRKLSSDNIVKKFDYILVDEIQDCTFADYSIFQQLLKPEGNLVLAGDLAQSIHLGASVHFPTSGFDKVRLKGSFRLPFRISEAIKPLSQAISTEFKKKKASGETDIINPYKGSPPGARPIIVYGKSESALAVKLANIFRNYRVFGFGQPAIFEQDWQLARELSGLGIGTSVELILKSKGLEKACVVWSTRIAIDTQKDVLEFVYTILTRTTSILIIAICEAVHTKFIAALSLLTQDAGKIICWDEETKNEITALNKGTITVIDDEDNDNSQELP